MAKSKCNCNSGFILLAMVLFAVGVYFLVLGFMSQTTSGAGWNMWDWNAMLLYLIGFVVFGLGKWTKWSGCSDCKVHTK